MLQFLKNSLLQQNFWTYASLAVLLAFLGVAFFTDWNIVFAVILGFLLFLTCYCHVTTNTNRLQTLNYLYDRYRSVLALPEIYSSSSFRSYDALHNIFHPTWKLGSHRLKAAFIHMSSNDLTIQDIFTFLQQESHFDDKHRFIVDFPKIASSIFHITKVPADSSAFSKFNVWFQAACAIENMFGNMQYDTYASFRLSPMFHIDGTLQHAGDTISIPTHNFLLDDVTTARLTEEFIHYFSPRDGLMWSFQQPTRQYVVGTLVPAHETSPVSAVS